MPAFFKHGGEALRALVLPLFLAMAPPASAAEMIFVEEYTYHAGDADSKLTSRAAALGQLKRRLIERLGTYLESATVVQNSALTQDQIFTLAAGMVKSEIIEERWDGQIYSLKARLSADPEEVTRSIHELRQARLSAREADEAGRKGDEARGEMDALKRARHEGGLKKGDPPKDIYGLSAQDWFQRGYRLGTAGRHSEAVQAFVRALELDPRFAAAYYNRGVAYGRLGDHRQETRDFQAAARLGHKIAQDYLGSKGIRW